MNPLETSLMTNPPLVLGLDADGVLLSYLHGLFGFVRSKGHVVACEPHEVDDWSCARAFPNKTAAEIGEYIEEFSVQPSFAHIPAIEGAVDAIHGIKQDLPDVKVVAITSAGTSPLTIAMRRTNLQIFPFDDIHVLPLGASKEAHLSQLPYGSVFVDDLYKHVMSAERVGLKGVLFRQTYNAMNDHHNVIENWASGRYVITRLLEESLENAKSPAPEMQA